MVDWLCNVVYFIASLLFFAFLFRIFLELVGAVSGYDIVGFFGKIKNKLTHKNDAYKDFVRNTEGQKRVVELPFSVIQPLLRDDSPIIVFASNDRLAIRDEKSYYSIHVKLSKKDYNEYIKFLEQKEINKEQLKKTEDTLAATELINKELKRINEEAMASIAKETKNINNIAEICEYLNFEEASPKVDALTSKIDTVTTYVLNDGMEWELKTVAVQSKEFDQELFDKIWNGQKVIIIRNEYQHGVFKNCRFDKVVHFYNSAIATGVKPLFARYYRMDDQWVIDTYDGNDIEHFGVDIIDLAKRCPDFTAKFKQRIQNGGIRYDRL